MKEFMIATTSTADLPIEYLKEHQIPFISYSYTLNDQVYVDDCSEESKSRLFKAMRSGIQPNTSQISEYAYEEFFRDLAKQGKDILFMDMTRALSKSIHNAEKAIETVSLEFPNIRIQMVESYSVTSGLALLLKYLVHLKETGSSYEECVQWAKEHALEYVHHFMVEDLKWLRKGGRLSNASAIVGSLLSIKPLIYLDKFGSLVSMRTVRGRKRCLKELLEWVGQDFSEETYQEELALIHADCLEDVQKLREELLTMYPRLKPELVIIMSLGPTIASHVGPDFVGVAYRGKKREA
ncbi:MULTISPECIES: DegV family protein [Terrabacteria group]|uniref:DegV family protein n=1 Tax=Bacillati TaxID=1783272 RepID=UPI001C6ED9EB|nr:MULTISPECIES: DegV family protein [Terrabacteria group]MBW9211989.1 DegV family protein [Trueperella sp. zg.1013]